MSGGVQDDGYLGTVDPTTRENVLNAISSLVSQIINKKWTLTLGLVKAVHGGGVGLPPTVDVQPMVNDLSGRDQPIEHKTIYGLPVLRLQGGDGAVIVDPKAGDIGLLAFASRDISSVVKNRAPSNPGSLRTFDPSDGMYVGGLLGAAPSRYIQIAEDRVSIVFSDAVKIELSSDGVVVTAGASVLRVGSAGVVTINGIAWATHTHAVTTAPGETGPPV